MSDARYGLYFAPEEGSALAAFGWDWLGRDSAGTAFLPLPDDRARVVADARRYGFHATLKAPFRLAEGCRGEDLRAEAAAFAAGRAAFTGPPPALEELHGFLALRPSAPAPAIHALADECVRRFDRFRRPAAEAERARRLAAGLTPPQAAHLDAWGYPYVFDQYRFHMTLTCRLAGDERARWHTLLAGRLGAVLAEPMEFRSLALFVQPDADAPFVLAERFPFAG